MTTSAHTHAAELELGCCYKKPSSDSCERRLAPRRSHRALARLSACHSIKAVSSGSANRARRMFASRCDVGRTCGLPPPRQLPQPQRPRPLQPLIDRPTPRSEIVE
eukprot:scaffold24853_cov63-Phaeocystis_antarctica.AAC.2